MMHTTTLSFYRCLAFARFWKVTFEDHLLNVNISITVGRIFTKNIGLYLYIFILDFFSKTGKTRVSHRVKMMTWWPGRERWPKWPIDPMTQFHVWPVFHKIITPPYLGYFTAPDRSLFIIPKFIPFSMVPVIQWRHHWRHRPWRMFAGGSKIIEKPLIRAVRGPTDEGIQQKWKTTITTRFTQKWESFRYVNQTAFLIYKVP